MKTPQIITFCIILLTISISCVNSQIVGNQNVVKVEREVLPFTSVITSNGWDLILKQGEQCSMIIETDENLVERVITEVNNGVLRIYSDSRIVKSKKRKIHLTFKEINSIKASGGSDIYAETIVTAEKFDLSLSGGSDLDRFNLMTDVFIGEFSGGSDANIIFESIQNIEINASGGSDIQLDKISGEACKLNLSGGSDAVLVGNINKLMITANGGSDIEAYDFNVKDCKLYLSGSSDAKMNIVGTLDITLSGGSDFSCKGNPQITNKNISKSCDFEIE